MAQYKVRTEDSVYTVEADSEQEAKDAVSEQLSQPGNVQDEQPIPTTDPELTKTGLPKFAQDVSQALTIPERIGRGVTVGANKLLENTGIVPSPIGASGITDPSQVGQLVENVPGAVQRGLEAFQPGFEPAPGEGFASIVGGAAGSLPLAMTLGPEVAGTGLAKYAIRALASFAGGGTFQAIHDASEKGHIDPVDVISAGGINAVFPIFRPSGALLSDFIRGSTEIPISGMSSLSREAMGELANDPKLLANAAGKAESIGSKIENVQRKMVQQLGKVGDRLKSIRLKFGITSPLETPVEQVATEGLQQKSFQEIAKDFVDLKRGFKNVPSKETVDVLSPKPSELKKEVLSAKNRIKQLYELRAQIDQNNVIKKKVGAEVQPIANQDVEDRYLKGLRNQVNDLIDQLAPQVKEASKLRLADKAYSEARGLYDEFAKKLSDPAKAEQIMMQIYKKGNPDEIIGTNSSAVSALRRLEKETGEKYIEPINKEFAAREFRNIKGTGGGSILSLLGAPGSLIETIGKTGNGTGMATILNFLNGTGSVMRKLSDIATSRAAQGVVLATKSELNK